MGRVFFKKVNIGMAIGKYVLGRKLE